MWKRPDTHRGTAAAPGEGAQGQGRSVLEGAKGPNDGRLPVLKETG